tara:strand:+ start:1725 stop:2090 length:366 start_codon:yes stop_codon:yes gene_type:complete
MKITRRQLRILIEQEIKVVVANKDSKLKADELKKSLRDDPANKDASDEEIKAAIDQMSVDESKKKKKSKKRKKKKKKHSLYPYVFGYGYHRDAEDYDYDIGTGDFGDIGVGFGDFGGGGGE